MDKKMLSALQIAAIVIQVITLIVVLALALNLNDRLTSLERWQAMMEWRLDMSDRDSLVGVH
jgi:multisubunit Na+/H+ antiporter MnhC subunit